MQGIFFYREWSMVNKTLRILKHYSLFTYSNILTSVRLFCALPAAVLFDAIGTVIP